MLPWPACNIEQPLSRLHTPRLCVPVGLSTRMYSVKDAHGVTCRMVSTTVLYGCHAIVSAALAFKAHAVRRAVRQHPEPMLM